MPADSGATTSLWMATATVPRFRKLSRNLQADVCVVGAGITGLTTAYLLGREGKSVVVLDDGEIGSGETGRTTAHLSFVLDDRFHVLERMHGAAGARLAAESHRAAVSRVEQIVRDERIECHFRRLSGYLVLSPDGKPDDLEKEREASRRAGLTDVRLLPRAPNVPWDTGPCLEFPNQAQFHPLRYIAALARAIEHDGGKIFTGSHVEKVEGRPRRPRVTTSEKHAVSAGAVVVATNSPISDYVVTHLKMAAYRTFAIGARIPRNSIIPALLWDTGDPYIYVRIAELDDTDDALIVGGEDHKTGQEDDADKRFRRLEDWARRRYPTIRSVSFRWSGQVMEPADGLAFIGPNPDGAKNVYLATGDSGQGMTHGTLAAMLLTDLILGRENPWESVYDPKRVTLRAVKEMMREGLNVARQYGDWVTPGEVKSVEDIPAGTGRLIRRGKTKIAAYRDERGVVHERSATCTHLGCLVDWNSAENSWDCPCHGSRFDRYGKVLNGPAIRELGEVEDSEA